MFLDHKQFLDSADILFESIELGKEQYYIVYYQLIISQRWRVSNSFSIISSHFKNGIYVLSLYWGMNTYAYQCNMFVIVPFKKVQFYEIILVFQTRH